MNFPKELPKVLELDNRIPRDYKHHINSDGSLCLGSPIRLIEIICENPTLIGFVQECLIPYLYSISFKDKYGIHFVFGELEHGPEGIFNDCKDLFKLDSNSQVIETLNLIKMKKNLLIKKDVPVVVEIV